MTGVEASFNTIQPAAEDFAESWSLREFTAQEVEQQRQLLADTERRRVEREQRRASLPRRSRIPPPPQPKEIEYYVLDPSDEEEEDDDDVDEPFHRTLEMSKWYDHGYAGPSNRHRRK